jgi:hypothetical protein
VGAEMGLEPLDNATQRRLGYVKALGGPAEMERFRNRKEYLELLHVQAHTDASILREYR